MCNHTETFHCYQPAETSIVQVLERLFTFGFTGLVQKQFRIFLSHTLRLTGFSNTAAWQSLIMLQLTADLFTIAWDSYDKAELFTFCF